MSATLPQPFSDCCPNPCDATSNVGPPGPTGPAGAACVPCADGIDAFTLTTGSGFTQPAVSSNVTVDVGNSDWMGVGQKIFVQTGGYYDVVSKPSSLQVILTNLGYTGNAAPAAGIASGVKVSPGGVKGTNGTNGSDASFPTFNTGDLIVDTGANNPLADPARLAVGTNGQVLAADSAQALDVKWTTVLPNAATDNGIPRFDGATGVPVPLQTSNLLITDAGAIQSTPSGGNARGAGAVDLQTTRTAATQVASGADAAISGGKNNTASGSGSTVAGGITNIASGTDSSISGGANNTASQLAAATCGGINNTASADKATVAGGSANVASGENSAIIGGASNIASAENSAITGGSSNTASAEASTVLGGLYGVASHYGQNAHASGRFSVAGDAQTSVLVARIQTTDATPAEMFLDGSGVRLTLADDTTWCFSILLVARRTDVNGEGAGYKLEGVIDRNVGVATTALVGTVTTTVLAEDSAAWDAAVTADTANGSLLITVTGEAAKTINWTARIELAEVTG